MIEDDDKITFLSDKQTVGTKAIVTLAIGDVYLQRWKVECEANWKSYASKYGYDIICIKSPLDTSDRANNRSPAWQKCLIAGQDFAKQYEQIVWMDADISINWMQSPSICSMVPVDKVGAVEAWTSPTSDLYITTLERLNELWARNSIPSVLDLTPADYYNSFGLPSTFDKVVQTGVMVFSPSYHEDVFKHTYNFYEDKGEAYWHYEMRPLSYELLLSGDIHWVDSRFNLLWINQLIMHYPFLTNIVQSRSFGRKLHRRIGRAFEFDALSNLRQICVNAAFQESYFLHFAGQREDMPYVDDTLASWHDCRFVV